jgi:plastocyanin
MKTLSRINFQRTISLVAIILFLTGTSNLHATTRIIQFGGSLGDTYSPNVLNVSKGDTIQWVGSFGQHAMASTTIPAGAASFTKGSGTSFTYVPTVAGTYNYQCLYHVSLGMTGSFTVLATGVENTQSSLQPDAFKLEQNYPNPFNPTTVISFRLSANSFTTLKIFNMIGQEVATLASETMPAGTYSRQWNAANMPSGFYFYRLSAVPSAQRDLVPTNGQNGQAGSFTETKRLVLLR